MTIEYGDALQSINYSGNNMATENFAAYVFRIMQIIRITEATKPLQKC